MASFSAIEINKKKEEEDNGRKEKCEKKAWVEKENTNFYP